VKGGREGGLFFSLSFFLSFSLSLFLSFYLSLTATTPIPRDTLGVTLSRVYCRMPCHIVTCRFTLSHVYCRMPFQSTKLKGSSKLQRLFCHVSMKRDVRALSFVLRKSLPLALSPSLPLSLFPSLSLSLPHFLTPSLPLSSLLSPSLTLSLFVSLVGVSKVRK